MSQPTIEAQPPPLPPRNPLIHNAAIAGTILCPIVMLLPPRKMDIRFFVLAGAFSLSTNQLAYAYTGQSIYSRFGSRASAVVGTELPEGARRTQQLLREHREREAAAAAAQEKHKTSLAKDIWLGGESEDWKEKRAEEHKKKFEEGNGLSDIIMEQIGEVFSGNWRGGSSDNKADGTNDAAAAAKGEVGKK